MPVYEQIVGQSIRLEAQLEDGATGKIVRATLRDDGDAYLTDVYLAHVDRGLYVDKSVTMPNLERVTAQFAVLKPDLSIDPDYSIEIDDFIRTQPLSLKSSGDVVADVEQAVQVHGEVERSEQIIRVDAEPSVTVETSDVKVRSTIQTDLEGQASGSVAVPAVTC